MTEIQSRKHFFKALATGTTALTMAESLPFAFTIWLWEKEKKENLQLILTLYDGLDHLEHAMPILSTMGALSV